MTILNRTKSVAFNMSDKNAALIIYSKGRFKVMVIEWPVHPFFYSVLQMKQKQANEVLD